jgi:hypothetical protein
VVHASAGRGTLPAVLRATAPFLLACAAVLGCGSKSSVALSARIQAAELAVEQLTLGTQLTGGFELFLEVGPEASGGATVSLESFALVRASDSSSLVAPLPAEPQGASFPVQVGKGQKKIVPFTLDATDLLAPASHAAICAEPVKVVGAVRDTLSGGASTPLESAALTPTGC